MAADVFNIYPAEAGGDSVESTSPVVTPQGGATRLDPSVSTFNAAGGNGGLPNNNRFATDEAGAAGGSA